MTGKRILSPVRGSIVVLSMILSACAPGPASGPSVAEWLSLGPLTAEAAFEYAGILDAVTGSSLIVDGREVTIGAQTFLSPELAIGQPVEVQFVVLPGGGLLAVRVEPSESGSQFGEFVLTGSLTAATGAEWTVGGIQISLPEGTEVHAGVDVGSVVHVEGFIGPDGQLVVTEVGLGGATDDDAEEEQGDQEHDGEEKAEPEDEAEDEDEVDGCEAEGEDDEAEGVGEQESEGESDTDGESEDGEEDDSDDKDAEEDKSDEDGENGCGDQEVHEDADEEQNEHDEK